MNFAELDLDSDDLQDIEFQVEMERYDAIIAKAHVIAENDRQRQQQEQDLESDGELLVLDGSLFNGMDGIESSQGIVVELGDVEMSGTGGSLAD